MWIDSHCHLAGPEYKEDFAEILSRAKKAGVANILVIGAGEGLDENPKAIALAQKYSECYAIVGVHPHDAEKLDPHPDYLKQLEVWAREPRVVAIGEIGLDFHYDHSPREVQKKRFREQLELAQTLKLPVSIHTRTAWAETVVTIREAGDLPGKGVFHCFSEGLKEAYEALELGFYLSISGIVTFKKAQSLVEVVEKIGLEHLLIETDGPFLSPMPHRGKRNEPAWVAIVGEKIAEIRKQNTKEVAKVITENTRRLFKL